MVPAAVAAALVAGDSGYPSLFGGGVLPGAMGQFPGVKPLFEDADEIIRYVKRTEIYPIIHIVTIKEETVERCPDLPAKLIDAFDEAIIKWRALSAEIGTDVEAFEQALWDEVYSKVDPGSL